MNLCQAILLISFYVLSTFSLIAQKQFTASKILRKSDSSIIHHAHIINVNAKIGVISDQDGKFSIPTKPTDTLLISFVGYESIKIQVLEIENNIYLNRAVHTIQSFTVLPYKDFKEFKEAFTKLAIKDTIKDIVNPSIILSVAELKSYIPRGMRKSGAYSNPQKERYLEMLRKGKLRTQRFNPQVIKKLTQINSENEIKSFMEYCDFTDQFIERSSHYNLVDGILYCFKEYKSLSLANK